MAKSGALAAILNFFLWGLGYLYIGKKTTFGVILVIGDVIGLFALAFPSDQGSLGGGMIGILSTIIVGVAFAYDANQLTKEPPEKPIQPN